MQTDLTIEISVGDTNPTNLKKSFETLLSNSFVPSTIPEGYRAPALFLMQKRE